MKRSTWYKVPGTERKEVKDDSGEFAGVQSMKGPCAKLEGVDFLY